jgi:hypothetical protein
MATGRIINLVWPQRSDGLIETYLPHSTEKDIINGCQCAMGSHTILGDAVSPDKRPCRLANTDSRCSSSETSIFLPIHLAYHLATE